MELLDYNKVLQDFQYKPNFAFKAYEREDHWWIRAVMLVEDARKPFSHWDVKQYPDAMEEWINDRYRIPYRSGIGYSPSRELIEVTGNYPIPYLFEGDDTHFVDWLLSVIKGMELHEMDEWATYKGELLHDPHEEV